MKKMIKMFVWKHVGAFGIDKADSAYEWVMKAPVYKRPIRLWCIKHGTLNGCQGLLDWLAKT